jgi:hypothetical protein
MIFIDKPIALSLLVIAALAALGPKLWSMLTARRG